MTAPDPVKSLPLLLLVDDDELIVDTLTLVLEADFRIVSAANRTEAVERVRALAEAPMIALIDLGLPPAQHVPDEGYQLISALLSHAPDLKIIVLSGQSEDQAGRHARALGATEFIPKPAQPQHIRRVLLDTLRIGAVAKPLQPVAQLPSQADPLAALIGRSPPMLALKTQVSLYADSPFPVLIEGESGSGKEVTAACLHASGKRNALPYFALNCAAISPNLMEPTLFGYAKGAFTGAQTQKSGFFEDADDGTLFLDEIGELPIDLQVKLLRVLENGEYSRVGETQVRRSRARIIAATNRDLRTECRRGAFRHDLYHRLSVFTVRVPPLRELGDDRLLLLDHFCRLYAHSASVKPFTLDDNAQKIWLEYPFLGNVRELRNIVIRLVTKHGGKRVNAAELELEFDPSANPGFRENDESNSIEEMAMQELSRRDQFSLDESLAAWENAYIAAAMKIAHGNISQAARLLGINRTTLYSRMTVLDKSR